MVQMYTTCHYHILINVLFMQENIENTLCSTNTQIIMCSNLHTYTNLQYSSSIMVSYTNVLII